MIVVVNRLQVPAGHGSDLEQAFSQAAGGLSLFAGFVSFDLWRDTASSDYVVATKWASPEAYQAWRASPSFRDAHRSPQPGVVSTVTVYEVINP